MNLCRKGDWITEVYGVLRNAVRDKMGGAENRWDKRGKSNARTIRRKRERFALRGIQTSQRGYEKVWGSVYRQDKLLCRRTGLGMSI